MENNFETVWDKISERLKNNIFIKNEIKLFCQDQLRGNTLLEIIDDLNNDPSHVSVTIRYDDGVTIKTSLMKIPFVDNSLLFLINQKIDSSIQLTNQY